MSFWIYNMTLLITLSAVKLGFYFGLIILTWIFHENSIFNLLSITITFSCFSILPVQIFFTSTSLKWFVVSSCPNYNYRHDWEFNLRYLPTLINSSWSNLSYNFLSARTECLIFISTVAQPFAAVAGILLEPSAIFQKKGNNLYDEDLWLS